MCFTQGRVLNQIYNLERPHSLQYGKQGWSGQASITLRRPIIHQNLVGVDQLSSSDDVQGSEENQGDVQKVELKGTGI